MVTNYPHRIATREDHVERGVDQADDGFVTTVTARIRQFLCGMHGHDNLLQFQRDRICLKCVSCGHETPGWELSETPPTISARVEPRRQAIVRPQLVGARRIA
jgi:hypothetical protein